jgi:hypothetical protein
MKNRQHFPCHYSTVQNSPQLKEKKPGQGPIPKNHCPETDTFVPPADIRTLRFSTNKEVSATGAGIFCSKGALPGLLRPLSDTWH